MTPRRHAPEPLFDDGVEEEDGRPSRVKGSPESVRRWRCACGLLVVPLEGKVPRACAAGHVAPWIADAIEQERQARQMRRERQG